MQDSPTINVRCSIAYDCVTGPLFFVDGIIMARSVIFITHSYLTVCVIG